MKQFLLGLFVLICLSLGSCGLPATPTPASVYPEVGASAGSVVPLSIEELSEQAQFILVGNVESLQSNWNEDRTAIYTDVSIVPKVWIKDETKGRSLLVRVPGGQIDDVTMTATDTPSFLLGEESVLFLSGGPDLYTVVGGFQGKYLVDQGLVYVDGQDITLGSFIQQVGIHLNSSEGDSP